MSHCQLYLITPPAFEPDTFASALHHALDAAKTADVPVACLQLRLKGVDDAAILRAAATLIPICQARGVGFLMNDRADLAKACGADGVHLGQTDGSVADARALLGGEADIGVTCHNSTHLAIEAAEAGADYVAFGAFFPTTTKTVEHHAEVETLAGWAMMTTVPCVAIGGVTAGNARPLVAAGADYLAVSSAVWAHPDGPAAGVTAFRAVLREGATQG